MNDRQKDVLQETLVPGRIERMVHSLGKLFRGEGCKQVRTRREDIEKRSGAEESRGEKME